MAIGEQPRSPVKLACKEDVPGYVAMQVVAHMVDGYRADVSLNSVDADPVPVPHFGLALSVDQFHTLSARMKDAKVRMAALQIYMRARMAENSL